MPVPVTKIMICTNKNSGSPIFYCHRSDLNHNPNIVVEQTDRGIRLFAENELFKVKANPQSKDRIDIYVSLQSARALGLAILPYVNGIIPIPPRNNRIDPAVFRQGNMQLPVIVAAHTVRLLNGGYRTSSGLYSSLPKDGLLYVDIEGPNDNHIMMVDQELHLAFRVGPPRGSHNTASAQLVMVPESELQKGTKEKNPVPKIEGSVWMDLEPRAAAGLAQLLTTL